MDVLFPAECRQCRYQRPVDGTCNHDFDQALRQYFTDNPHAPYPIQIDQETTLGE